MWLLRYSVNSIAANKEKQRPINFLVVIACPSKHFNGRSKISRKRPSNPFTVNCDCMIKPTNQIWRTCPFVHSKAKKVCNQLRRAPVSFICNCLTEDPANQQAATGSITVNIKIANGPAQYSTGCCRLCYKGFHCAHGVSATFNS